MASPLLDSAARTASRPRPSRTRWAIVPAAVLLQLALGAVYAWSVFSKPLQQQSGWSKSEAVLPFIVAIGTIVTGAVIGGRVQDRHGPRLVAVLVGGAFFPEPTGGVLGSGYVAPVVGRTARSVDTHTVGEALRTRQWYLLVAILALDTTCDLALISQASDAFQAVAGATATAAAAPSASSDCSPAPAASSGRRRATGWAGCPLSLACSPCKASRSWCCRTHRPSWCSSSSAP